MPLSEATRTEASQTVRAYAEFFADKALAEGVENVRIQVRDWYQESKTRELSPVAHVLTTKAIVAMVYVYADPDGDTFELSLRAGGGCPASLHDAWYEVVAEAHAYVLQTLEQTA